MLSLSIFSSSQRISVAIYEGTSLKVFAEKKIESNKIDRIFLLLKKVIKNKEKKIKKIFYSVGPGSFTAIRSIKSIAEGISSVYNAEILTINDFEIYLTKTGLQKNDVIVFFEVTKNKYFYRYFQYNKNSYKADSNYSSGELNKVLKFINEKKKKKRNIRVVSNLNSNFKMLKNFNDKEKFICKRNAKKIAEAIFMGFGKINQKIIYYNTYYE